VADGDENANGEAVTEDLPGDDQAPSPACPRRLKPVAHSRWEEVKLGSWQNDYKDSKRHGDLQTRRA